MLRFHVKVSEITEQQRNNLRLFVESINNQSYLYTKHCIDRLKYQISDYTPILLFIKDLKFKTDNIFEWYEDNNMVKRVCFRLNYNEKFDLILILDEFKHIVTTFLNLKNDNHETLNTSLYTKVV